MNLSFRADCPFVESNRWIASLSDGTTVFEDRTPNVPSSWIRLQRYVKEQRLVITCLRLQAFNQLIQLPATKVADEIIGYWHSKRIDAFLDPSMPQTLSMGIGYISKDKKLYITWVKETGIVETEIRDYDASKDIAGIIDETRLHNDSRNGS